MEIVNMDISNKKLIEEIELMNKDLISAKEKDISDLEKQLKFLEEQENEIMKNKNNRKFSSNNGEPEQ